MDQVCNLQSFLRLARKGKAYYMKTKRLILVIVAVVVTVLASAFTVSAETISGTCGSSTVTYTIEGSTLTVGGSGEMPDYDSASRPWDTYAAAITAVNVKDGVTKIGSYAFVGINANVTVSDTVSSIGDFAIGYSYDGTEYALIQSLTINGKSGSAAQSYANENGITFNATDLENKEGICADGINYVLTSNGVLTLTGSGNIPAGLSSSAALKNYKSGSGDYVIKELVISEGFNSIGASAFADCTALTKVTLPSSIRRIEEYCFESCTSLKTINIPEALFSIGKEAFSYCTSLESISLGNTLTTIEEKAFWLSGLKTVSVPSSVTELGEAAFLSCESLTEATVFCTNIPSRAFSDCTSLKSVTLSSGVSSIGANAFDGCSTLTNVSASATLKMIHEYAFKDCTSLVNVSFPKTLSNYGNYSFYNCTALESFTFSDNVTVIPEGMFYGCTALSNVEFGDSIEAIQDYAFVDCTSLKHLFISYKVRSFGNYCLGYKYAGTELNEESIEVPVYKAITEFKLQIEGFSPSYAMKYANDNGLSFVEYKTVDTDTGEVVEGITWIFKRSVGSISIIGEGMMPDYLSFDHTPWAIYKDLIRQVTFSTGILNIGSCSFEGCVTIGRVDISGTVQTIGTSAFAGTGIESISFPSGIREIANSAFEGCSALYSVTLPTTLVDIGESAFKGPNLMSSIFIPKSVTSIGANAFGISENDTPVADFVIKGIENSAANIYANQHNIDFKINGYIEIVHKDTGAKVSIPGTSTIGYQLTFSHVSSTLEPSILIHPTKSAVVYNITLLYNGMDVKLDGEAAIITIPIPSGLENDILYIYKINSSGEPVYIEHQEDDGMLVFSHGSLGDFVVTNANLSNLYTITVKHNYSDGTAAAETVTVLATSGAQYRFTAESFSGYSVNKSSFAGSVSDNNIVIEFVYTKDASINPSGNNNPQKNGVGGKFLLTIILIILVIALIAAVILFLYLRKKKKNEEIETHKTMVAAKKHQENDVLAQTIIVPDFATREIDIQSLFADDPEEDLDAEEELRKQLDKNNGEK